MKKKSIITMLVSVALVAVIGVGATLAYFTDKEEATNVVTLGNVDITLDEYADADHTNKFEDLTNIKPGDSITKIPVITNSGALPCYVRALVKITNPEGANPALAMADLGINATNWYVSPTADTNGYYTCYYQSILAVDGEATLFTGFKVPSAWNNAVADKDLTIDVKAEAVQADNFTPEMTDGKITGWSTVEIEKYTSTSTN